MIQKRPKKEETMTLQQLRYVVTIAEIGTISKAAEELFCITAKSYQSFKRTGKRDADHDLRPHEQREFMYPEKERSSLDMQDRYWSRRH